MDGVETLIIGKKVESRIVILNPKVRSLASFLSSVFRCNDRHVKPV